jgi:rod shape-determining protein MreC
MRLLFKILYKNRILVLFVALEILALVFIYLNRSYQGAVLISTGRKWSGKMLETRMEVVKYLNLNEQNALLSEQNARLMNSNPRFFQSVKVNDDLTIDTLFKQVYEVFPARVINASYNKRNNYLTLDRGTLHGVEPGMGVVGPQGVVGIVKNVSKHYASVLPILHSRTIIGAQLKSRPYFGAVTWPGGSYRFAEVNDLPAQSQLAIGDTLVSDERSGKFPSGIPIGQISKAELIDGFTFKAEVELFTDFSALREVYLIRNLHKREREALDQETQATDEE